MPVQIDWDANWQRTLYDDPGWFLVLDNAAVIVEIGARRRCPVHTGRLRDSIHQVWTRDIEGRHVVQVGSDLDYALPVELGHTADNGHHVPAQPYLRPGLDDLNGWTVG